LACAKLNLVTKWIEGIELNKLKLVNEGLEVAALGIQFCIAKNTAFVQHRLEKQWR
jgi:hypothetical protein